MLIHPILDKLQTLRFFGMLSALEEQMKMPDIEKLSFEDRFGLLVDREMADRLNRRLPACAKPSCGKMPASKISTFVTRGAWTNP